MRTLSFIVLILVTVAAHGEQCSEIPAVLCTPATKAAQAAYSKAEDQLDFLRGYRYGYLQFLIDVDEASSIRIHPETSPFAAGLRAAMRHAKERSEHKPSLSVSLDGFGYKPVEQVGKFSLEFERSHFIPGNNKPIWCYRLSKALREKSLGILGDEKTLKVKGWLSPEGIYGHMGACRYEVVIDELSEVK